MGKRPWSNFHHPTKFGEVILDRMRELQLPMYSVYERLEIKSDHFNRILESTHASITLSIILKLAEILDISVVKLIIPLYDQDLSSSQQEMGLFLVLFDRFYRLENRDRELLLGMSELLLKSNGSRPLDTNQEQSLELLRVAPKRVKRGGPTKKKQSA